MEEVRRLGALEGADLRDAKEVLAFEATKLAHGEAEAEQARATSKAAFGGGGADLEAMPTTEIQGSRLEAGIPFVELLCEVGLTPSKGAARRLIQQGGAYLNGAPIEDTELVVKADAVQDGSLILRFGKKRYHRVIVA
jgi:tyrosyl-tRNA synthetase